MIALFIFRFQLIWVESDMTRGSFKSFTNNLKPICEFCQLFVKADVKENYMGSSSSGPADREESGWGFSTEFYSFSTYDDEPGKTNSTDDSMIFQVLSVHCKLYL